jgi:hypothetical protein
MDVILLSPGPLSALLMEGIKYVLRNWILKDPNYDFPVKFYMLMIPLLNALMPFALVALGMPVTDPILTMTWQGVIKYLLLILLNTLVSLFTNTNAINPVTDYRKRLLYK